MTYKKNFNDTAVFRTKNVRLVINSLAHLLEESNKLSKSFIFVSENIHDLQSPPWEYNSRRKFMFRYES